MNICDGNPWVLDVPGPTVLTMDRIKVTGVRWVGAIAAGHRVVLTDADGDRIWSSEASGANYVEAYDPRSERLYTGLVMPTLDSGILEVEFG